MPRSPASATATARSKSPAAARGKSPVRGRSPARAVSSSKANSANGHAATKAVAGKPQQVIQVSWALTLLVAAALVVLPLGIYWCWICVKFNRGHMVLPAALTKEALRTWFVNDILLRIRDHAMPRAEHFVVYGAWLLLQSVLFVFAPGSEGLGAPLANGRRLKYIFNGQASFYATLAVVAALHFSGWFRITYIAKNFAQLLSVCEVYTFGLIAVLYVWAKVSKGFDRPSNSIIYDYWMGPMLNPRVTLPNGYEYDIKWFHELRPGIMHWYFTTLSFAALQYEETGYVSTPMLLICFMHLCFTNACYKGEPCVPYSMDIVYECFGWMLMWLDIVVVPFIFPLQAFYIYTVGASLDYPKWVAALLLFSHCLGYWMFDTANQQKDYFRHDAAEKQLHSGFPQLPWGKLKNPAYMDTKRGTKLLVDGWWKYARHINYLGDIIMAWSWALTCGVSSFFPFVYAACYLTPLLIHRERRDDRDCARKYGDDWERYKKLVPWRMIPYVY